ncbi:MAG: hypothetical protein PVF82_17020 [Gammaproteobacteria bacterium]|jgi:uncharacterized protein (DUF2252 family)
MTSHEVNVSEELKALEHKKSALEKVMKIARAVEQLRYGLEAVVLLGKPTARISHQAVHIFEALSEKIRIQPTKKIQESVQKLDAVIANNLNAIMELARPENEAELHEQVTTDETLAAHIDKLIQDYRKSAQTAVALRVVLRERGVPTVPIKWSVSVDGIRTQISQLNNQELQYRKKIKSEITLLQHDALTVANNENLSQSIRDAAVHMHKMLQKDLEHLNAGKDVATMPFFVEVVEIRETAHEEAQHEANTQPPPPEENNTQPQATIPAQSTPDTQNAKPGFMHKLWRWSTTPPNVTWQDVDKECKKK